MTKEYFLQWADICKELAKYYEYYADEKGIFGMLGYTLTINDNLVVLFKEWSKFSGNYAYPVPHPYLDPKEAFHRGNLWGRDEYGDNRRELAAFLAKRFRELAEQEQ